MSNAAGKPNLLRRVNRNIILDLLEQKKFSSRAELSEISGLSPPTVSTVVKELIGEGWILEVGGGASTRGKKPQLLTLNKLARIIAAVQFEESRVRMQITDLTGKVLIRDQISIVGNKKAADICEEASYRIADLLKDNILPTKEILGIGVSVPGIVDGEGTVFNAPELGWDSEPVGQFLKERLDMAVLVQNDVKLATLGESWHQQFTQGTMVYIHLGRGIGAGIIIDGQLYQGKNSAAGEIGNLIVNPETLQLKPDELGSGLTGQGPFERFFGIHSLSTDNRDHRESVVLTNLSYGLANVISVLDPDILVFGGPMVPSIQDFLVKIQESLAALPVLQPQLCLSGLGDNSSLFGATRLVLNNYKSQVTFTSM